MRSLKSLFRSALPRFSMPGGIRYSLWVILILASLNFLMRLIFLVYNFAKAEDIPNYFIFKAFLTGFRFDIATIMLFNGIIFFFLSLPLGINRQMRTFRVVNFFILFINIPILIVNSIDVVYFGFADKRLTHELYSTRPEELFIFDMWAMLRDYGWLLLMFLILSYGFYRLLNRLSLATLRPGNSAFGGFARFGLFPLLVAIAIFLGMRGGTQPKRLDPGDAFNGQGTFAGDLGLNSAFTVYFSVNGHGLKRPELTQPKNAVTRVQNLVRNSFDTDFLSSDFPLLRKSCFNETEKKLNVVFIVVESFDALNVGRLNMRALKGPSVTPFFDSLSMKGVLFSNYFAPANRSIEFPPSIVNSMPDIFHRPLIGSEDENSRQYGLAQMLKERAYHTSWYHGGRNGTMGFDRYTKKIGFDHYFGMNEYPQKEKDFDGGWGIYDGPFMKWWANQLLEKTPEPFFSLGFTVSNHHPFFMPEKGTEDIRKLPLSEYKQTTLYTDRALRGFFQVAEKAPWYNRTIFVITGDHTFHEHDDPDESEITHANVPLLILAPGLEPAIDPTIGGHLNLLPTMIDVLKLNTLHSSGALSLFEKKTDKHFAIYNHTGVFSLLMDGFCWSTNFLQPLPFWYFENNKWHRQAKGVEMQLELRDKMDQNLRALLQVFGDCRFENKYWSPEVKNIQPDNQ